MKQTRTRALALLGAGTVAGAVLAGTLSANAASSTPSPSATSAVAPSAPGGPGGPGGPDRFSSAPVRGDEKAVSSSLASSLTAKAQARTGGTVYRVETDAGDGTYEAHVKKADGSLVTVKFDSSGSITAVEDGMGTGDPAPAGAPQPPASSGSTTG